MVYFINTHGRWEHNEKYTIIKQYVGIYFLTYSNYIIYFNIIL